MSGEPIQTFDPPPYLCPQCGQANAESSTDDPRTRPPRAGDVAICNNCAAILIVRDDGSRSPPLARDLYRLVRGGEWQRVQEVQRRVAEAIQRRRPHGNRGG